jgi:hypothetical protein
MSQVLGKMRGDEPETAHQHENENDSANSHVFSTPKTFLTC